MSVSELYGALMYIAYHIHFPCSTSIYVYIALPFFQAFPVCLLTVKSKYMVHLAWEEARVSIYADVIPEGVEFGWGVAFTVLAFTLGTSPSIWRPG